MLIGGGAAGVAVMTKNEPRVVNAVGRESPTPAASGAPTPPEHSAAVALGAKLGDATAAAGSRRSDEADRTATRAPRRSASGHGAPVASAARGDAAGSDAASEPRPPAGPAITTQTVTETRAIPYQTRLVRDPSLPRGRRRIATPGIPGEETLRWLITFADGKQTGRRLIDATVTRQPQHRVIAFGSRGRGPGRGHSRECGMGLDPCLPLGRSACPAEDRIDENGVHLGGSVTVLDEDLALLNPSDLDGLELDPALVCRQPASEETGPA